MNTTPRTDDLDLYVDGLLDAPARAAFEERVAREPGLRAELDLQRGLERELRARFTPPTSFALRARPALPAGNSRFAPRAARRSPLMAAAGVLLAASLVFALAARERRQSGGSSSLGAGVVAGLGEPGYGSCVAGEGLLLDGAYARLDRELAQNPMLCGPTLVPSVGWPLWPQPAETVLEHPSAGTVTPLEQPDDLVGCTVPFDAPPAPVYTRPPGFPISVRVDATRPLHGPLTLPSWPGPPVLAVEAGARPHFVFVVERALDPHPRLMLDPGVELVRTELDEHVLYELKPIGQTSCLDLFPR